MEEVTPNMLREVATWLREERNSVERAMGATRTPPSPGEEDTLAAMTEIADFMDRRAGVAPEEKRLTETELAAIAREYADDADRMNNTPISMRMPTRMLMIIKEFARRADIGYQVLMKRWLEDRVRHEATIWMANHLRGKGEQ